MASKAFSLLRSSARLTGSSVRCFSSGYSNGGSKKALGLTPFLIGSVTAACAAGGLSYYTKQKYDRCSGILETVSASAYRPEVMAEQKATKNDRTFIMIKPDGVQRGLIADIIKRFEQRGYKLVAMKFLQADEDLLKKHYADLSKKPFFPSLIKYVQSGPVVAMVWEGLDAVKNGRTMLGETMPSASKPGSIRGDYCIQVGRNIIHGSDSNESAAKEIDLWFSEKELVSWTPLLESMVYED